jgi:hypothetical protein
MFLFVVSSLSLNCSNVPVWLFNCTLDISPPYSLPCPSTGFYDVPCRPLTDCDATYNTTIACYPTEGKSIGTALTLSLVLGWAGADRFYLGYPTIGLFKLFTGGFFGLGWYLDIFMLALGITQPARGGTYQFKVGAPIQVRLPGPDYY